MTDPDAGGRQDGGMDHYHLRKYRGPEVWRRARAAYEEGETGPSVARRFDVGLANLRKKARREGWSRKDQAEARDRAVLSDPAPGRETPVVPIASEASPDPQQAPEADLGAAAAAPEPGAAPTTRPEAAVAAAVARASTALAEGRSAEAVGLLRAAETLARLASVDPSVRPEDNRPLTPEEDAAREARARAAWDKTLDLIEAQGEAVARQMLADVPHGRAVHLGFVHEWRARHLGPEAAAADLKRMQDNAAFRVPFYWDEDGHPLPVSQMRERYHKTFRAEIRRNAGLPERAPGEGD